MDRPGHTAVAVVAVVGCAEAVVGCAEAVEAVEAGVGLVAVAAVLAGCLEAVVILEVAREHHVISAADEAWAGASMAAVALTARANSMGAAGSTVLAVGALTELDADSMEPAVEGSMVGRGADSMAGLAEGLTGLAAWTVRPV